MLPIKEKNKKEGSLHLESKISHSVAVNSSREELFHAFSKELDGLFDYISRFFEAEKVRLEVIQYVFNLACATPERHRYKKYFRLWIYRLATLSIKKFQKRHHLSSEASADLLAYLSLEEKQVLFLIERAGFSTADISSILRMPEGRVGRVVTYAREKVAECSLEVEVTPLFSLPMLRRIEVNHLDLDGPTTSQNLDLGYLAAMKTVSAYVKGLTPYRVERTAVLEGQFLGKPVGLFSPKSFRWSDLSWQQKMGVEAFGLAAVGLFAMVVLPWVFARVDLHAMANGKFQSAMKWHSPVSNEAEESPEISADKLLATSLEGQDAELASETASSQEDEFADMDFPSGDSYEVGSSPIAPSRQGAAVYRMIVQSASPRDLIPVVRDVFAGENVRERERSGRVMPGGVYFDGITNVGNYHKIERAIGKLGQTKTYTNPGQSNGPNERARVIIWLQQI